MPKFRKKPIVIEAEQFIGQKDYPSGICYCSNNLPKPHIHTLEGIHEVKRFDWIITGVQGERYPCKPDIFDATYEPVE